MRPTRPYHAVTSRYRLPGGLRALDFFMDRVTELADEQASNVKQPALSGAQRSRTGQTFVMSEVEGSNVKQDAGREFEVLVICNQDDQVAIPFAAMGLNVTSIHASEAGMRRGQVFAEEVGVQVNFLVLTPENLPDAFFDAIVFADDFKNVDEVSVPLSSLNGKLKPDGRVFATVAHSKRGSPFSSLSSSLENFRAAGWRAWEARNAGMFLNRFLRKWNNQKIRHNPKLFHALDAADGWLASILPRAWADGWLLELVPFGLEPLIIQLVPTLAMGGAERIALQLAQRMKAEGFQSLLVTNVSGGPLQALACNMNVRTLILDRKTYGGRWGIFWRQYRLFADLKPDLLHTHLFAADFWGRVAAKLAGVRHIVTTEHNVRTDHGRIAQLAMRLMTGLSDRYVAVSKDVAAHVVRDYGISPQKLITIYNGIDLARIRRRSNRVFNDVPHLIFVGRLEAQKNPDVLLRALSKIQRPWHLTIYGAGSMDSMLHRLADESGIAARVAFEVRDDMSKVYADADLMIFPSQWEGLGLAAIEAAVAGVPLIVSRLAPLQELFGEADVTFVTPGNVEEVSQRIQDVLADPSVAIERGARTAAKDWSPFSLERMTAAYAELYRGLLKKE